MTERVDIANLALTWLGADQITSLEDDLDRALAMRINYIPARDATLEAHDWSFAMFRFIPSLNATAPVYGAGNAFDVPPDVLRVISVDPNDSERTNFLQPISSAEQIDWVFENRQIICNEQVIYVRAIRRIDQEGFFSPNFVLALAAKLAFMTAISLTASAEIQANMASLYAGFLHDAKTRDGLQGRSRRIRSRLWQKVR